MSSPGHVYFIHAIGTDRYKIGKTRRTVQERLNELNRKQSAYPLELKGSIEVDDIDSVEMELHKRFSAHRVHGEWFTFTPSECEQVFEIINTYAKQNETQYYYNDEYSEFPLLATGIGIVGAIIFIFFLLAQCSNMSNPKYRDCYFGGGGSACDSLLKSPSK